MMASIPKTGPLGNDFGYSGRPNEYAYMYIYIYTHLCAYINAYVCDIHINCVHIHIHSFKYLYSNLGIFGSPGIISEAGAQAHALPGPRGRLRRRDARARAADLLRQGPRSDVLSYKWHKNE